MRTALLLALCPSMLAAQDVTRHAWGTPVADSTPSVVSVEPCEPPCVALVRFDNTLIMSGLLSGPPVPVPMHADLSLRGLPIAVTVEQGTGQLPDLLRVRVPPGYAAEPAEVLVQDNASGSLRVVLAPTS